MFPSKIVVGDKVEIATSYPSCGMMRQAIGQVGKVKSITFIRNWEIAEVETKDRSYLVQVRHLIKK